MELQFGKVPGPLKLVLQYIYSGNYEFDPNTTSSEGEVALRKCMKI
jgi:hypothetical protein